MLKEYMAGLPTTLKGINEQELEKNFVVNRDKTGRIISVGTKPDKFRKRSAEGNTPAKYNDVIRNEVFFDKQGNPTRQVSRSTYTLKGYPAGGNFKIKGIYDSSVTIYKNGVPVSRTTYDNINGSIRANRTYNLQTGRSNTLITSGQKARIEGAAQTKSTPYQYNPEQNKRIQEQEIQKQQKAFNERDKARNELLNRLDEPAKVVSNSSVANKTNTLAGTFQTNAPSSDLLFTPVSDKDLDKRTKQEKRLDNIAARNNIYINQNDPLAPSLRLIALQTEAGKQNKQFTTYSENATPTNYNLFRTEQFKEAATEFNNNVKQKEFNVEKAKAKENILRDLATKETKVKSNVPLIAEKEFIKAQEERKRAENEYNLQIGNVKDIKTKDSFKDKSISFLEARDREIERADTLPSKQIKILKNTLSTGIIEGFYKPTKSFTDDLKTGKINNPLSVIDSGFKLFQPNKVELQTKATNQDLLLTQVPESKTNSNIGRTLIPNQFENTKSLINTSEFLSGTIKGIGEDIRDNPTKNIALAGAGFGTGKAIAGARFGVAKLSLSSPKVSSAISIGSKSIGAGVGAVGVSAVGVEVATKEGSIEDKGILLGRRITEASSFGLGVEAGLKTKLPQSVSDIVTKSAKRKLNPVSINQKNIQLIDQSVKVDSLPKDIISPVTNNQKKAVKLFFSPNKPVRITAKDTQFNFGQGKSKLEPLVITYKDGNKIVSQPAIFTSKININQQTQIGIRTEAGQTVKGSIGYKPTKTKTKPILTDRIQRESGFEIKSSNRFQTGTEIKTSSKVSSRRLASTDNTVFLVDKGPGTNQVSSVKVSEGKRDFIVITNARRSQTTTKVFELENKNPKLLSQTVVKGRKPINTKLDTISDTKKKLDAQLQLEGAAAQRLRVQTTTVSRPKPTTKEKFADNFKKLSRSKSGQKSFNTFERTETVGKSRIKIGEGKIKNPKNTINVYEPTFKTTGKIFNPASGVGTSSLFGSKKDSKPIFQSLNIVKNIQTPKNIQDNVRIPVQKPKFTPKTSTKSDLLFDTISKPKQSISSFNFRTPNPFNPSYNFPTSRVPPILTIKPPSFLPSGGTFNPNGVKKPKKKRGKKVTPSVRAVLLNITGKIRDVDIKTGLSERPLDLTRLKI